MEDAKKRFKYCMYYREPQSNIVYAAKIRFNWDAGIYGGMVLGIPDIVTFSNKRFSLMPLEMSKLLAVYTHEYRERGESLCVPHEELTKEQYELD